MKKLLKIMVILFIMLVYSTNSFGWVPVVVVPHYHNKKSEEKVDNSGQEIYKHFLGVLIGKEIQGCKVIDSFYWNHKINIICVKDGKFLKNEIEVEDWKEERGEGIFKGYWFVDITKDVLNILVGEESGETIQEWYIWRIKTSGPKRLWVLWISFGRTTKRDSTIYFSKMDVINLW